MDARIAPPFMEATDASRLVCVVVVSYQEYSLRGELIPFSNQLSGAVGGRASSALISIVKASLRAVFRALNPKSAVEDLLETRNNSLAAPRPSARPLWSEGTASCIPSAHSLPVPP